MVLTPFLDGFGSSYRFRIVFEAFLDGFGPFWTTLVRFRTVFRRLHSKFYNFKFQGKIGKKRNENENETGFSLARI